MSEHHHDEGVVPHRHPLRPDQDDTLTYWRAMEIAVRELLIEKQITTADEVRAEVETMDSRSPSDGARVVALDQSRGQLLHARALLDTTEVDAPLVCASAESVPLATGSFDLVMCDHGAMSFCDPDRSVAEAARVLRAGGRLVFSHTTPWPYLAWNFEKERVGRRLRRSYFGIRRFDDGAGQGTVDFQLPYGEWIRCFRRHGLAVDDLVELQAPEHATTTYDDFDPRWARRWPAEQIWVTRKEW